MPPPANATGRLEAAAARARQAEARGDDREVNEAWRVYRLIEDSTRDPDELIAEGIALSYAALRLSADARGSGDSRG